MKLSLKIQDEKNPVLKARIPISIFSQPFVSSLTTPTNVNGNSSNKSSQNTPFSLCTNFPSGPCLKLSYAPSTSPSTTIPFFLSLKSGLGLFGSPKDSSVVFSAQFSISSANPGTIIPAFSLHFKPQFDNFSFYKATLSKPSLESDSGSHHSISAQSASPSASVWQDVKLEQGNGADDVLDTPKFGYENGLYSKDGFGTGRSLVRKDDKKAGIFCGISVRARTMFPVTKSAVVNLRWTVNLPSDVGSKMPYLTINKIGIEKLDEVKEMKECMEDMRHGVSARRENENSNDLELWRNKKSCAEDNGGREGKKNENKTSEVESELQKAIKVAPT
ncbi:uncharacterized protein LOC120162782 [Hibiscus syriacus]|uniref:uncharacterized protein LOC120162782 n=1 Tax=Hibiscus syriacus TaxID=106335 RepID=UPI0019229D50|nr:uncharacterized protein LOC120162782 [Hibiscus syriacus]